MKVRITSTDEFPHNTRVEAGEGFEFEGITKLDVSIRPESINQATIEFFPGVLGITADALITTKDIDGIEYRMVRSDTHLAMLEVMRETWAFLNQRNEHDEEVCAFCYSVCEECAPECPRQRFENTLDQATKGRAGS